MNKSQQVRAVFSELRRALGNRISELETLEHAAALVDLFAMDDEEEFRFDLRVGGIPFDQWALDSAFSDGGWRVLGREHWMIRNIEEEDEYEQMMYQGLKRFSEEVVTP